MDVICAKSVARLLGNPRAAERKLGRSTRLVMKLVDRLRASENLEVFLKLGPTLNGRCHRLKGDLDGTFSVDLVHPYRMLFVPEPPADRTEDGYDYQSVTSVRITSLKEDTHK